MRDHKSVIGTIIQLTNGPINFILFCGPYSAQVQPAGNKMKITEADAVELKHDSYVMHIHQNSCTCGSGERYGLVYEVWVHPTKTRLSGFKLLKPAGNGPLRTDVPMAYMEMPRKRLVVCSDCVHEYKTHEIQAQPAANPQAWAETLKRKYTPEPQAAKTTKSDAGGIPAPTADQL